jgi:hypothetical protein
MPFPEPQMTTAESYGTHRAIDHAFSLVVEGDLGLDVGSLFAGLAAPHEEPATTYTLRAATADADASLFDGQEVVAHGSVRFLLQHLISRISSAAIEGGRPALHASAVSDGTRCVLLTGPSGVGKSTLAARLIASGLELVAEDVTALDRRGEVLDYHRPLGLSGDALERLELDAPLAPHGPADYEVKMLVSEQALGARFGDPVPVAAVCLVDRNATEELELTPAACLAELLTTGATVLAEGPTGFEPITRLLSQVRCLRIGSADLDAAAERMRRLLELPSPQPLDWLVDHRGDVTEIMLGTEAVLVRDDTALHLNAGALAIWLLVVEGMSTDEIAAELELTQEEVDETIDAFSSVTN